MKTLYLDLGMGAAGDMLTAALLELCPDPEEALAELNGMEIPAVRYSVEKTQKCGVTGTRMIVSVNGEEESDHHDHDHDHDHHDHDHRHHGLADIEHIVNGHSAIPDAIRKDVLSVFGAIAEAESRVHGVSVPEIHFHEVGTMDAIADVAAVCYLMKRLAPDEVVASPVCTGFGQVKCAHGILPVPAPATALLLRGLPTYGGEISGELCTPTGAALIAHFVTRFGSMPVMRVSSVGYGCGKKDFPAANAVRASLGETEDRAERTLVLSCNIDDMTGEEAGFAMEEIRRAGALDVVALPALMKKRRPGTVLEVLCKEAEKDAVIRAIFRHTTTIGIREVEARRYVLDRKTAEEETGAGMVRKKISTGYGVTREKYEYEDLARLAREKGVSLAEIRALIEKQ